ncbi:hypothetical protein ACLOJK_004638 [Asimina triloba]
MADSDETKLREESARVVEQARELQDSASSLLSKTWNEQQSLCQRALALESNIKKIRSSIEAAVKTGALDICDSEKKLDEELFKAKCIINDGDAASLLPSNLIMELPIWASISVIGFSHCFI